jgi:hypothetical protein
MCKQKKIKWLDFLHECAFFKDGLLGAAQTFIFFTGTLQHVQ